MLHIGDVHMDRPFSTRDESVSLKMKKAIRLSFTTAVDFCIENDVDFLVISGDLFDSETVSPRSAIFLHKELKRLSDMGIDVIYATGNHDSGDSISELRYFEWPRNVTVFAKSAPQVAVRRRDGGRTVAFVGAGYEKREETRNLVALYPKKDEISSSDGASPDFVVGVAHSHIDNGFFRGSVYMPCVEDDISDLGYDYFALGHIHRRQILQSGRAGYSGSLQALKRDETGMRGGILVEMDEGGASTSFVDLSRVVFEKVSIDIGPCATVESAIETICGAVSSKARETGMSAEDMIMDIELKGASVIHREMASDRVVDEVRTEIRVRTQLIDIRLDASRVTDYIYADDYAGSDNVLGYIVDMIHQENGENEGFWDHLESVVNENHSQAIGKRSRREIMDTIMNSRDEIAALFVRSSYDNQ